MFGKIYIYLFYSLLLIGIIIGCIVVSNNLFSRWCIWTNEKVVVSMERGDKIVLAIKAYYKKNRKYPSKLEKLVPDYISKIKPTTTGNKTWYYTKKKIGFSLEFESPSLEKDPFFWRTHNDDKWHMYQRDKF